MNDPSRWRLVPDDPRAPPHEVWERMSPEERAFVVASLPSEFPVTVAPEGDPHFNAKVDSRDTLRRHFDRIGRSVYLACELPVYYPDEPMFAPDVMAVLDTDVKRPRMSWVVDAERKGLDLAIEIHVAGDRRKDLERNVERYARLGISEYFIFDRGRLRLSAFRLAPGARIYQPVLPQAGRYTSAVLVLDLAVQNEKLCFFSGNARLFDSNELIQNLEQMMEQVEARARASEERIEEESRKREEESRKRVEAEKKLAAALAELEQLKRRR